jgi:hypothetical protein
VSAELHRTTEGLFASSSSARSSRQLQRHQIATLTPTSASPTNENGGEKKEKEGEESEDDGSSETDESERDDELKSSIFVTSNTTTIPRFVARVLSCV